MATIRRTDIIQKKYSKGRPAKPERERLQKRQEAYKWRDARRIYLASSFDRWRKLRSTLKMKDSSLAWHLMEAHEKSQCSYCRQSNSGNGSEMLNLPLQSNKKEFLPSLIASIRQLCNTCFEFEDSIEIVGQLCLEFDRCRKENFSLNELIKSGLKPTGSHYISESLREKSSLSNETDKCNLSLLNNDNVQTHENSEPLLKPLSALFCRIKESHLCAQSNEIMNTADKANPSNESYNILSLKDHVQEATSQDKPLSVTLNQNVAEVEKHIRSEDPGHKDFKAVENNSISVVISSSDGDPSLEIDLEIMDNSQEDERNNLEIQEKSLNENVSSEIEKEENSDNGFSDNDGASHMKSKCPSESQKNNTALELANPSNESYNILSVKDHVQEATSQDKPLSVTLNQNVAEVEKHIRSEDPGHKDFKAVENNSISVVDSSSDGDPSLEIDLEIMDTSQEGDRNNLEIQEKSLNENLSSEIRQEENSDNGFSDNDGASHMKSKCPSESQKINTALEPSGELPLDMSILKSTVKQEPVFDIFEQSPYSDLMENVSNNSEHGGNSDSLSHHKQHAKKKMIDVNHIGSNKHYSWNEHFQNKFGKHKDEPHVGIPWQRRDMSRKEEYEYLEFHPFCDLAEFSQHYPHVHQRTYYRWKRRIKEEFIILEQCPSMDFQEFSSIVLQAKESVYQLWKSLISQGKGFFAPSDSSKRLEAKCAFKPISHSNELVFLQKNLTANYEQFSQQYPGVTLDVFNVMKRKVMQEFWLYYQNQHMNYKDFSKLVNISEDVFFSWKEYIGNFKSHSLSQSLTITPGVVSPTPSMTPQTFHALGSPKSSKSNVNSHLSEDRILNILNGSSSYSDSGSSGHTNSLNESLARNLSASYIASLQSLMFPWHSYYGMTSPLGQQMLPMMLWPQMLGLSNPLSLIPSTSGAALSSLQVPTVSNSDSPVYDSKFNETAGKPQSIQQRVKRLASDEIQETSFNCDKKMKVSYDKDDSDFWGSINRSRKQNKQEYVYYLKNPELGFKELESLFPSISLRTFYRWRKEMNAAVMLLEDNKDMSYQQFQMVFPDIPEEVFDLWKNKSEKISFSTVKEDVSFVDIGSQNDDYIDTHFMVHQMPASALKEKNDPTELSGTPVRTNLNDDTAHHRKYNKEEYIFVQKSPDIDFATFSKMYPNISVRSFYRWKKELKDSVDYLKANPAITYDVFRHMDSSVTEEIFNIWKTLACNECPVEDLNENTESVEEKELKTLLLSNRKYNGPEYAFLQLNPNIEFSHFSRTYPEIPKRTFYRWKREIQQIIHYIRAQPTVTFSDISPILPEVSQEIFQRWKDSVNFEGDFSTVNNNMQATDSDKVIIKNSNDESSKIQTAEALLYLMRHPTISYQQFRDHFDHVSPVTFELWLIRIHKILLHIASVPDIDYSTFSLKIRDITEDIFDIWKNLGPADIANIKLSCERAKITGREVNMVNGLVGQKLAEVVDEVFLQKGFEYCQNNSLVTDEEFQSLFPGISVILFNDWKAQISEEINYIKCNPDITFVEFSKLYPQTKEDIFNTWRCQSLHKSENESRGKHSQNIDVEHKVCVEFPSRSITTQQVAPVTIEIDTKCDNKDENPTIVHDTKELHKSVTCKTLAESSLSKLTKFADNTSNNGEKISHSSFSAAVSDFLNNKQNSLKRVSVTENLFKNNNNVSLHLESELSPSKTDALLNSSNSASSVQHPCTKTDPLLESYNSNLPKSSASNSSLSALMAMSGNGDSCNSLNHSPKEKFILKKEQVVGNYWQGSQWGYIKDEDEAFSSQRQKKMSRAEYMFVKDNPDVDSQEFSRIFPQVSARTFYRWKKEIKAQLQMA
ncbi:hypothetical protein Btru_066721 [Bulinus truncatus]|nr:hypothetical protein Btru_066721 [Bulinus truncatus]